VSWRGIVVLLITLFAAATSRAAGFIKFDGIDGEAKDKDHKQWIDVVSVSWPAARPHGGDPDRPLIAGAANGPPAGAGKLTITAHSDAAAVQLQRAAQQRTRFSNVLLELPDANGRTTRYVLSGVTIDAAHGESGRPTEQLSLNYEKIVIAAPARAVKAPPARAQ
jgi:type VI protein secretion system component Hcp